MTLIEWFEAAVDRSPDAPAVRHHGQSLSYRQLDAAANRVAHVLRGRGLSTGHVVGVAVDRSVELAIGVLGVLKAGCGYLPLDAAYPAERLRFMRTDARAEVVLTARRLVSALPLEGAQLLCLDDPAQWASGSEQRPGWRAPPEALVYAIYTSGSTGTPKGVAMHQAPLVNLIAWQLTESNHGAGRTLQFAPLSFDVHFQELFSTWAAGGCVVLIDEALRFDAVKLLQLLACEEVNRLFLPFVALQSLAEAAVAHRLFPKSLAEVVTAGEQLRVTPALVQFFSGLPHCRLFNHYGPSETHVVTSLPLQGPPAQWPALPSIGKEIDNVITLIVDDKLQPVPNGTEGELFLGGAAVAQGYLYRPELTAQRFITHPAHPGVRFYRSGDLARRHPDGTIDFLGRLDGQVKVRGYRIELGEVEAALSELPNVAQVAVAVREDEPGDKRLVAYWVLRDASGPVPSLKSVSKLPEYMIPSAVMTLSELPRTPSGKIDRRSLPKPSSSRPTLQQAYVAPHTALEQKLAAVWESVLQLAGIGTRDSFFELGGNSLLALNCLSRLKLEHQIEVPVVKLFERPTIEGLARWLEGGSPNSLADRVAARTASQQQSNPEPIALVGMAGRFPGADDVETFWNNLAGGVESVTRFEVLHPSLPPSASTDPRAVKARGILRSPETFDAAFFGITPREAELMDPQQRQLLEVMWEAVENAGYTPATLGHAVGVWAGAHNNSYYPSTVVHHQEAIARLGAFQVMVANEKDYVATRVAHKFNFSGPAISVQTACSTSLVAIAQACEALSHGHCDVALAGGTAISVPVAQGHLYTEGGMLSADGHCRPFDAKATGTLFSDGVGVVVLKPLSAAQRDGDTIYALIKGWAVNNDGSDKMSFAAPSVAGQAQVVAMAQRRAGVEPRSISYIEAHGTATPLGDPIEVEALTQAFALSTTDTAFCAIGSVKSNFGHLTAAAGVAGLMKTALALKHQTLPASLHFESPNPKIDFSRTPFVVNSKTRSWPASPTPRRAGVSSFGVGGTNAHVVLEEAPAPNPSGDARSRHLVTLSARSASTLSTAKTSMAGWLGRHAEANLADVTFVQHLGRTSFGHRVAFVARNAAEAKSRLDASEPSHVFTGEGKAPPVAFLFPGQGSQYVEMGKALYRDEPEFRLVVDECAALAQPVLQHDLREVLYPAGGSSPEATDTLKQTKFTQTALFTVEYALARLLGHWGVTPTAMLGHSVGEWVAATLAGVFSVSDAIRLVATRATLMQARPPGSMVSVRMAPAEVAANLPVGLSVASENGPSLCVVAGPSDAVAAYVAQLEAKGVVAKPLHTSHAFHSSMMDPVVAPLREALSQVTLSPPRIPIASSATGTWLTDAEATSPDYWAQHLRVTVKFSSALATLATSPRSFVEVGPRATLATLARQQISDRTQPCFATLPDTAVDDAEWGTLLAAVGRLWVGGVDVDFERYHEHEKRRRIALPTTPFEPRKHWLEPPLSSVTPQPLPPPQPAVESSPAAEPQALVMTQPNRKNRLLTDVVRTLEDLSGLELAGTDPRSSFLELGLDSLALTQVAIDLSRQHGFKVTFRQLLEEFTSPDALAAYLDAKLPASAEPQPAAAPMVAVAPAATMATAPTLLQPSALPAQSGPSGNLVRDVIDQQLRLMAAQLQLLGGAPAATAAPVAVTPTVVVPPAAPRSPAPAESDAEAHTRYDVKKAFGAMARISTAGGDTLSTKQRQALESLTQRYNAKTKKSKAYTQQHRSHLADPRVVTGFKPLVKELIYQIVIERSKGSRMWDLDGNEYIDCLNGFGSNFFGHSPDFIVEAVKAQIDRGYELGPQHPLAGEVAQMVCEMTGHDRAALCNTGSEAVLGCLRIARTVTGRSLVAIVTGAYHGINDEVIVRGTKSLKSVPASPGILPNHVQGVLVLDYGTPESMAIIKQRAHELAAVMVEPIQSRRPDFQPAAFLKELRDVTRDAGSAYIFDEVITGFRLARGGAQQHFGVQVDLCSYGKVVGGGQPIGVMAGKRQWMDALDGGHWQYGDASVPTVGVTYFAGTFVRHPIALAAAKATLEEMKRRPDLQQKLNAKLDAMAGELNSFFVDAGVPLKLKHFGSLWKLLYTDEVANGDLLFCLLRDKGLHIWDGFPCFLTTAFSDGDIATLVRTIKEAVTDMQQAEFLGGTPRPVTQPPPLKALDTTTPPVPGARLGRDPLGNPAWFVPNPNEPGKYLKVN